MGRPQLVDPLEDLGQAGDDQGELELGDLDEAVFVLLHVAPRVVRLWACSTWQLVLKPGHMFRRISDDKVHDYDDNDEDGDEEDEDDHNCYNDLNFEL